MLPVPVRESFAEAKSTQIFTLARYLLQVAAEEGCCILVSTFLLFRESCLIITHKDIKAL